MNIFVLDVDPVVAAKSLCDRHVVKMALETAQLLSTALVMHDHGDATLYRPTHRAHPCTRWAALSRANFLWLALHGISICEEYTARYTKQHASLRVILAARDLASRVPDASLTDFAQAMPDAYRRANAVDAYRAYYIGEKARFATWRSPATPPMWWSVC